MTKSGLSRLLIIPAIIGVIPVELLGMDARLLQRLPVLGPNGLPYWEPILLLASILGYACTKPTSSKVIHWVGGGALLVSTAYFVFRGYGPLNQTFGLFLQFSSIAAMTITANASKPALVIGKLERPLVIGGLLVLVSSAVLALTALGFSGWWGEQVTQIDRFEGIDERLRWTTVRLQDRALMCFIASYCTALAVSKRKYLYFAVPFVLFGAQLVQSSRGGVLLVLASAALGAAFVMKSGGARFSGLKFGFSLLSCMVVASIGLAMSDRAQILLSTWAELIEPDGVRNRMYAAAWELMRESVIAGVGYIDLHAQPEWSPFVLPTMLLPLHNMFMQALLYEGVIGALLWLIPTILAVKASAVLVARRESFAQGTRPLVAGLISTVPAFVYMMGLQTLDRVSMVMSWVVLGSVVSLALTLKRVAAE